MRVRIRIDGVDSVRALENFFAETYDNPRFRDLEIRPGHFRHYEDPKGEMIVGHVGGLTVGIRKDGEFPDRYSISICGDEEAVGLDLVDPHTTHLREALRDLLADYDSDPS